MLNTKAHPAYIAMGKRLPLIACILAILAAAFTLPAAYELTSSVPTLLPVQPHIILFLSCFLLGILFEGASAALHARLSVLSGEHTSTGNGAPPVWREMVDSLRILGAIITQPTLCAAFGLLPVRYALWSASSAAGLCDYRCGYLRALPLLPLRLAAHAVG